VTAPDPFERLARLAGDGAPSSDFDLAPDLRPQGRVLRAAAVLIGFEAHEGQTRLYLTKRSSGLKHHPGQIAFPGGKVDAGDADAPAAALREAREEIGLPERHVEVLGTLAPHETVTGFSVTPVLGRITRGFTPVPEAGEVDEVFTVPFEHIADPSKYVVESRFFRGVRREFYTVPYGPYYIWGATARILRGLADRLTA